MTEKGKRDFKVKQTVYVVDCWGAEDGMQAFEAQAKILYVDGKKRNFNAVLYGHTYKRYSFEDYGRLIFDTAEEAKEAADKLPKPKSVVYQKIDEKSYKRTVCGIYGHYVGNVYDLVIRFEDGKEVSTKEIGISIFLTESAEKQ